METIGSYLKQQRERAEMSLEQVSKATKIRATLLTSLEADRMDDLPGGVFMRGFVRAYAETLRIRPDRAMELLDGLASPALPEPRYASPLDSDEVPSGGRLKLSHMLALAVVLLSLVGGWYAFTSAERGRTTVTAAEATDVDSGTTKSFSPHHQPRP